MSLQFSDERAEQRISADKGMFIQYKVVEIDGKPRVHASTLFDYSCSGLKVVCYEPLPIGQILQLTIGLKGKPDSYDLTGQIKWCLEVDEIPTYHAGICFLDNASSDFKSWLEVCAA
ncbi:PilZ domain-containing protein [Pleionea mediterranea]|jgi:hypothetical protein|uniref:PilZ domain-containing protein n=1 Tax=Pleionea mediterranea TaxID=523701 RepID=A0A316FT32_9GAMM|nr:PilZ domain-containing protein [Pleionea mediterranea]PWK50770.1 hypothetical protein C8D97_10657 [Pleionea mediterranea]